MIRLIVLRCWALGRGFRRLSHTKAAPAAQGGFPNPSQCYRERLRLTSLCLSPFLSQQHESRCAEGGAEAGTAGPKVTERSVAGTVQALCKHCASTMQDLCKQVPFTCKLGQEPQPNLCVFTIFTISELRPSTLIITLIRVTLKNVVQKHKRRTGDLLLEFYQASLHASP